MQSACRCLLLIAAGCGRLGFDETVDDPGTMPESPAEIANLIAHWSFEDLGGSGSVDLVGGHAATCTGSGCPTTGPGAEGQAAIFDGTNDCMLVPSLDSFTAPVFTISAWVDVAGAVTGPVVAHENNGGCPSPEMSLTNGSLGLFQLNTADGHNESWALATMMSSWHHVVVRWDGTQQRLYVDGRCCTYTPSLAPVAAATAAFSLGCYPATGTNFVGGLDEVRIYDRPLSSFEVAALYEVGGRTAPAPGTCTETCKLTPP